MFLGGTDGVDVGGVDAVGREHMAAARAVVAGFAASFDPDLVSAAEALRIAEDATAVVNMAETIKALAFARAAETSLASEEGDRSAAHNMARKSGTSVGKAKEQLKTAKKMRDNPTLEGAARSGELSSEEAAAIADATDDEAETEALIDKAKDASLGELKDECARTKALRDAEDPEARHKRIRASRYIRRRTTADGAGELHWRSTLDELAEIWSMIQSLANERFKQARAAGERESHEAYGADALLEMARRAAAASNPAGKAGSAEPPAGPQTAGSPEPPPAGPQVPAKAIVPSKMVVRVDWDALVRGWPIEGKVCEIAGIGPVPVSLVRAMIASGDPFLVALATRGVDVHTVAHLGRKATAHQHSALDWSDPTCSRLGCNATEGLQIDHREDWAQSRITLQTLLDRLCAHDHASKTREGWALVDGHGNRPMVPPDDPRHPKNKPKDEAPPLAG